MAKTQAEELQYVEHLTRAKTYVAEFVYRDASGELRYVIERHEWQQKNGKRARRFSARRPGPDGKGWYVGGGVMDGIERIPYNLMEIEQHRAELASGEGVLLWLEGEGNVDAAKRWLAEYREARTANNQDPGPLFVPTSLPFGSNAPIPDEIERHFGTVARGVIVADNDVAGIEFARKAEARYFSVASDLRLIDLLPGLKNVKGADIVDYIELGKTPQDLLELIERTERSSSAFGLVPYVFEGEAYDGPGPGTNGKAHGAYEDAAPGGNAGGDDRDNKLHGRRSQANRLVDYALPLIQLVHDDKSVAYAILPFKGRREFHPLRSGAFRRWLSSLFFAVESSGVPTQAVNDAIGTLEALAAYGPAAQEVEVNLRVGGDGFTEVCLDLSDEQWRMVRITAAGWEIVPHGERFFRRSPAMLPLPEPVRGGSLSELREFVSVESDDAWALFASWVLQAVRPIGPYAHLALIAEHGTGKSTAANVARSLIDPARAATRSEPREERDVMISLNSGWVLPYDNLSRLPGWLSDSLCRISTGAGFSTRRLYTDDEEQLFEGKRPAIITAISDVVTRPDLLDRVVTTRLGAIPKEQRRSDRELWAAWIAARPRVLGGLCDALSLALRNIEKVEREIVARPRMADFFGWSLAAEEAFGVAPGTWQAAYEASRGDAHASVLEASVILRPMRRLLLDGTWEGTATALLAELEARATEAETRRREWPRSPRGLSGMLRHIAPSLRAGWSEIRGGRDVEFWVAIEVETDMRVGHDRIRMVRLTETERVVESSPPDGEGETL